MNVLLIDHLRCFQIPSFRSCKQVGIRKRWRHDVANSWQSLRIPKQIEDLDITVDVCFESVFDDELCWHILCVYRRRCRLEMAKKTVRSDLTSPISTVEFQVDAFCPVRAGGSEFPRIQLGLEYRGECRCPLCEQTVGIQDAMSRGCPGFRCHMPSGFEILYDWTDSAQRYARG